jgi:hypothetical protein
MVLARLIAGWASAALVAAVMLFAPAMAQAHSVHEHAAMAHGSHAQHQDILKQHANTAAEAAPQVSLQMMSTRMGDERDAQDTGNCLGSCCGNGLGCCGAIMFTAQQALPDVANDSAIAPLDVDYGTGVDPDSLKRPPRTLA